MKPTISLYIFITIFSLSASAQSDNVASRLIGNDRLGKKDSVANWSIHAQLTATYQYHPAFHAAYSGINSLSSEASNALSLTSTLFAGRKLWKGAAIFLNPELSGGHGFKRSAWGSGFSEWRNLSRWKPYSHAIHRPIIHSASF